MPQISSEPNAIREAFSATLDWWREAGVEEHVSDAPDGWLRKPEAAPDPAAAVAEAPSPTPADAPAPAHARGALSRFLDAETQGAHPGDPEHWPDTLDNFHGWWMESDTLDPPGAYPRIAPRGTAGAQVMLIVDQPLADDREALLEGPAGTVAANMLRAMGFAPDARYLASILPRHNLRPDWEAVGEAGYGALLLHHIGLVRPERIIGCGNRVWSLMAHAAAQEPAVLTTIESGSAKAAAFAIPDLQTLLRSPAKRAQTWNRWLDWTEKTR
ncbi:uracil-DNA glycosylase family protein [Alteriqipengyuania sp. 357]